MQDQASGPAGHRLGTSEPAVSNLNPQQFTLYRGEGSHGRPSYYPKSGPNALAGAWWTSDLEQARGYASKSKGSVYKIDVDHSEAEPHGLPGYYMIKDPKVRERRVPLEDGA